MCAQHSDRVQGRQPFRLKMQTKGGHASMPVTDGSHAAARMAKVLQAIDSRQPQLSLRSPVPEMLRGLAPKAPFLLRGLLAYSRVWYGRSALSAGDRDGTLWCMYASSICNWRDQSVRRAVGLEM